MHLGGVACVAAARSCVSAALRCPPGSCSSIVVVFARSALILNPRRNVDSYAAAPVFHRSCIDVSLVSVRNRVGTSFEMNFLIVIGILVALAVVFVATIGLGPLAIIPFGIAVIVGIWFLVVLLRGSTPAREVRRRPKAELLGPGGPDDPDA